MVSNSQGLRPRRLVLLNSHHRITNPRPQLRRHHLPMEPPDRHISFGHQWTDGCIAHPHRISRSSSCHAASNAVQVPSRQPCLFQFLRYARDQHSPLQRPSIFSSREARFSFRVGIPPCRTVYCTDDFRCCDWFFHHIHWPDEKSPGSGGNMYVSWWDRFILHVGWHSILACYAFRRPSKPRPGQLRVSFQISLPS